MCKYKSSETLQTQQLFNKNPFRPKHVAAIRVLISVVFEGYVLICLYKTKALFLRLLPVNTIS